MEDWQEREELLIVKKLINMNLSVQQIAKAVQLSENEVEKILNTK